MVVAVLAEALEFMDILVGAGLTVAPVEITLFGVGKQKGFGLQQHAVIVFAFSRFQYQVGLDRGGQLVHINAEFGRKRSQWFGTGYAAGGYQ